MSVFQILIHYRDGLLNGLSVTVKLCLIVWITGLILGAALGYAGARWKFSFGLFSRSTALVLAGIPVLVTLFWLHYPVQQILGVVIDPFITASVALSIINIFAVSEIVREALVEFPVQYVLAARSCGMAPRDIARQIQLPIIFRQTLPAVLLLQVNMLQATLFASLISVDEIFRVAQEINAEIYRPVQVYSSLAVFFLAICLPLNGLALLLKKRYTRNLSER